jgi:hypothetical protein
VATEFEDMDDADPIGPGRYAPPRVTGVERTVITGSPDKRLISTSMIERQNLTMRMSMRAGSANLHSGISGVSA